MWPAIREGMEVLNFLVGGTKALGASGRRVEFGFLCMRGEVSPGSPSVGSPAYKNTVPLPRTSHSIEEGYSKFPFLPLW